MKKIIDKLTEIKHDKLLHFFYGTVISFIGVGIFYTYNYLISRNSYNIYSIIKRYVVIYSIVVYSDILHPYYFFIIVT